MIKKNIIIYSLFIFSVVGFSSCQRLVKSIEETLNEGATEIAPDDSTIISSDSTEGNEQEEVQEDIVKIDFLDNRTALQEAEDSFRNRPELIGKEIKVYRSIHFYSNSRVSLEIQNPDIPSYVDSYYYTKGKWEDPKPVELSKSEDITKNMVSLDRIPFVNANNVYKAVKEKQQEIGSEPSDLTVYVVINRGKVSWYPRNISNGRSRFTLKLNQDGTLQSMEQD